MREAHTHTYTHSRTRKESGKCNADDGFKIPRGKRRGAQHILTTSGAAGLQQGATKCGKGTATATATGTGRGRAVRGVCDATMRISTPFSTRSNFCFVPIFRVCEVRLFFASSCPSPYTLPPSLSLSLACSLIFVRFFGSSHAAPTPATSQGPSLQFLR